MVFVKDNPFENHDLVSVLCMDTFRHWRLVPKLNEYSGYTTVDIYVVGNATIVRGDAGSMIIKKDASQSWFEHIGIDYFMEKIEAFETRSSVKIVEYELLENLVYERLKEVIEDTIEQAFNNEEDEDAHLKNLVGRLLAKIPNGDSAERDIAVSCLTLVQSKTEKREWIDAFVDMLDLFEDIETTYESVGPVHYVIDIFKNSEREYSPQESLHNLKTMRDECGIGYISTPLADFLDRCGIGYEYYDCVLCPSHCTVMFHTLLTTFSRKVNELPKEESHEGKEE